MNEGCQEHRNTDKREDKRKDGMDISVANLAGFAYGTQYGPVMQDGIMT